MWIYFFATALAVLVLRRTEPALPRPFRAPALACVVCMAAATLLIGSTLWQQAIATSGAILLCGLAWPARWLWGRRGASEGEQARARQQRNQSEREEQLQQE